MSVVPIASEPVKFAAEEIVWLLIAPDVVIVPIFKRLPDASIRWVPADAPVLIPVVPFNVVPVIVLAVAMVPKPEAIEPEASAPTVVSDEVRTPVPSVLFERTFVPLIW